MYLVDLEFPISWGLDRIGEMCACNHSHCLSPLRTRAGLTASCRIRLERRGSRGSLQTLISARLLVSFTANSSVPNSASFHNQTYINDLLKYYYISAPSLAFTWRPIINWLDLIKWVGTRNENNCTVIQIPGETSCSRGSVTSSNGTYSHFFCCFFFFTFLVWPPLISTCQAASAVVRQLAHLPWVQKSFNCTFDQ